MNRLYVYPTFLEIYETQQDFADDYATYITNFTTDTILNATQIKSIYYLLVAKYGENPINNRTLELFKNKLFATIYQYAPMYLRKLAIQKTLRSLTEDEILVGAKQIYNHAFNPSSAPSTSTLEELDYINDQNTASNKKGKLDAYSILWSMLSANETEDFLRRFKVCFQLVVDRQLCGCYYNDDEEEQEGD